MAEKMHLSFFIFAMIGFITLVPVSSKIHIIGDQLGWSLPNYSTFYYTWAKKQNFAVGDELRFKYRPGLNTVLQVNKDDYDHCTTRKTISTFFRGDTIISLDKPGDYFFINSVGKHCEGGQKIAITVPQGKPSSH